jgi:AcrR family transcriptional regulator
VDRNTAVTNKNCHIFQTVSGILDPQTPTDIAARTQRARIIDAMVESCAAKTFPATTISDVVSRASISRTTFYKHFTDKRACFDATVDSCVEEVAAAACAAHQPADPPGEAVTKATAAILALLAQRPALAQLLTGDAPGVEPAVVERYRKLLIPAVAGVWERAGVSHDPHMDPSLAFGRAQVLIFTGAAGGEASALPQLLPELVYLAVAPFAGHEEALAQVRVAAAEIDSERSLSR